AAPIPLQPPRMTSSSLLPRLRQLAAAWAGSPEQLIVPLLLPLLLMVVLLLPARANALDLAVSEVSLEPCPASDIGAQPQLRRPSGASCYALRGVVTNNGRKTVVDTDVFAQILDASGEPVLQNRSRVGSIGDVPPGRSSFALRLAIPAGTPGPFQFRLVKARGFSAPVRTRAEEGDELLPLEQQIAADEALIEELS
ncbi:MAG: hypothetical protein RLZZ624_246, partial [Cyanobacteriota bacterium]